ncbi:MAG: leucine-rich repeat protein [Clostridia bacterium]|nr:leucine-rich repeat protein [Clostridia bacterium]
MKKALSILLSLILVLAALPFSAVESSAVDYHTSQDGEWMYYLNENNEAIIYSGSTSSSAYLGSDTDITVPSTLDGYNVVSIGQYTFKGNTTLESIVIPNTVNTISNNVFQDCTNLASVTLGNSVGIIGPYAFCNCTALESITIPSTVTNIGAYAFANMTALKSITIPGSVTTVGDCMFEGCTVLEEATVGNGVPRLSSYMFHNCYELASISIPDSVTAVDYECFWNCRSLDNVVLGNSVQTVGRWAFEGCSNLESLYFPATLTSIAGSAFNGCSSLNAIHITDLAAWCCVNFDSYPLDTAHNLYLNGTLVTDLVIPDGVTEIKKGAFSGCTPLTSLTMSDTVQTIGNDTFRNCSALESVYVSENLASVGSNAFENDSALNGVYVTDLEAWCNIAFSEEDSNPLYKAHNLYVNNVLSKVTVPNTVTEVKQFAFAGIDNDVVFTDNVTAIGKYAFYQSTTDSVILNSGLLTIGEGVFNGNTGLVGIKIPDTVASIGGYAFANMTALKSITVPGSVTTVGDCMFEGCTVLEEATVGNGVPRLSSYMFHNCYELASISIPDSVTAVDYECFWNCRSLDNVVLGNSVQTVGSWAFEGCSGLRYIIIPESVTSIQGNSFNGCAALANIICYKDSYAATYNSSKNTYLGDMDSDGTIDINDIGAVISASVGLLQNMTEVQQIVADYNLDGAIDGFDAAEVDRYVYSINTAKGDVNQDGNTDLADYAMTKAHISGVAVDNNTPANLLDKSYLTAEYDSIKDNYPNGTIITQQYYCADYDGDKAVDAFDLFYLDKRINNLI